MITHGSFTRDFYFLPSIHYHSDGTYHVIELVWLNKFIGKVW